MSAVFEDLAPRKAWVVFSGQTDLFWLKILKPGFRHCYALLHDGRHWLSFDPLSNYTEILVHNVPPDFDVPAWLRARGHFVVPAPLMRPRCAAPWMIYSCVEAVKRIIGLHARFVFTPWQLYRHLTSLSSRATCPAKLKRAKQEVEGSRAVKQGNLSIAPASPWASQDSVEMTKR